MSSDSRASLRPGWILSPGADAWIFSGSLIAGLLITLAFGATGLLSADVPSWLFVLLVAGVDVAHVYATAFRVYLDPARFRRHRTLYIATPVLVLAVGQLLHAHDAATFWRALAYLAVFHFVRQQWGWVAYTRRRAGEGARDFHLDRSMAYAATVAPLVWWHATLPRDIAWFMEGDFLHAPRWLGPAALAVSAALHVVFALRQLQHHRAGRGVNWAKIHVLATTSLGWLTAIVLLDSDIAFTALNVLGHGIPYLAVIWRVEVAAARGRTGFGARLFRPGYCFVALFILSLALLGYTEEWLWHQLVWHDHEQAFPGPFSPENVAAWTASLLVPLLAGPQAAHYLLHGWLWRVSANPDLRTLFD